VYYISGYCYCFLSHSRCIILPVIATFSYLLNCLYLISCGMLFVDEVVVSVCWLLRGDYFNFVFSFSVTKVGPAEYEVCVCVITVFVSR
jgi:hypothetical protein